MDGYWTLNVGWRTHQSGGGYPPGHGDIHHRPLSMSGVGLDKAVAWWTSFRDAGSDLDSLTAFHRAEGKLFPVIVSFNLQEEQAVRHMKPQHLKLET